MKKIFGVSIILMFLVFGGAGQNVFAGQGVVNKNQIDQIKRVIQQDIKNMQYDGAALIISHKGKVVLRTAIGYADRDKEIPLTVDHGFYVFSLSKTMTSAAVLMQIDRGYLALDTKVADIFPEFGQKGKKTITIKHLLTHTGGISSGMPGTVDFAKVGNLKAFVEAAFEDALVSMPDMRVSYSPLIAHAILGRIVETVDPKKRSFQTFLNEEFFTPLNMKNSSLGMRKDLLSKMVPVVVRDKTPGLFNQAFLNFITDSIDKGGIFPAGGVVSTVDDIHIWAEMLLNQGKLKGKRVLSKSILELATQNHTGIMRNELFDYARIQYGWPVTPAYLGLGFFLRGEGAIPTPFGVTASKKAFGGLGAGSCLFVVDPERDFTFTLLTSGLMEEGRNFMRFQKLSDMALASIE